MTALPVPAAAAVRAVRQYRRRDVVPYLALRYYLANRSARRERWGPDVAVQLVLERRHSPYFAAKHFKGRDGTGVEYRDMFLPCANEALAEAVLLAECAKHENFRNPHNVFSYQLAGSKESDGMFQNYFIGLRSRHAWIARACRRYAHPVVHYADVRKFYPSIPPDTARGVWDAMAAQAALPARLLRLGHSLIDNHVGFRPDNKSLLTGPMFSHLLGNLVLRDLDQVMSAKGEVAYCRYVDDIVLVGPGDAVRGARKHLEERLAELNLSLHPLESDKDLTVDGPAWLRGEDDFRESTAAVNWKSFIGGLKWLLTSAPQRRADVKRAFQREGFRLPVPDYSGAVHEATYIAKLESLLRLAWFKKKRRSLDEVVAEGRVLRDRYLDEIEELLTGLHEKRGYERRRAIPKVRYRAGRLVYLASQRRLAGLAEELRNHQELEFHAVVLMSVATGDVTDAIRLGTNVAQAVAQPLRADGRCATVQGPVATEVEAHGVAILGFNGVEASGVGTGEHSYNELLRLACYGATTDMMRSSNPFMSEFASLHGIADAPRHAEMLDSAFDVAEESVFDAVSQAVYLPSDW